MSYTHKLACLLLVLGTAALGQAQSTLGTPVAVETPRDNFTSPPSLFETGPLLRRPLIGSWGRVRPSSPHLMPPLAAPEPTLTKEDVARITSDGGFSPAEITAAKIKFDESQAKTRQAAVRYLATVDCTYYPEAEASLIAALRADRSESVRYEAAVALGTCRGATKRILEALNLSALGYDLDGNPPESSDRVRQAARNSLNRVVAATMPAYTWSAQAMAPTMPLMPYAPVIPWFDPYAVVPTQSIYPTGAYLPPISNATNEERELAETISAPAKTKIAPPAPSVIVPTPPRTLAEWIQNHTTSRQSLRTPSAASSSTIDPRLRGLTPLGSIDSLSIPNSPVPTTTLP